MAAYSSNYQFAQSPPAPPQQQQYGAPQQQQQQQEYAYSTPGRMPPRRSLSMGSAHAVKQQMALVSFDPYASTATAPAATASTAPPYNNYSLSPTASSTTTPYNYQQGPPSFANEEMTTSPHSHFGFAQPPQQQQYYQQQQQQYDASDISMFSDSPFASATTANENALVPSPGTDVVPSGGGEGDFSEGSVDPAVIAEQERIWQDIQDRRKMERIRADNGVPNMRAVIPYNGSTRQTPARTRSMPHPNSRSQNNSLARGGVAVLDPKKDLRKQTRKMKTAGGAVGGAVVGGLILGPVGVVLGAGGGAAVSNKLAKSRDKRKQQEYEQRNFQKGASSSVAAKGDGSFV